MIHLQQISRNIFFALVLVSFTLFTAIPTYAQSTDAYDDLFYALNGEVDDIYTPYAQFFEDTATMEDTNLWLEMFNDQLAVWDNGFRTAERVYLSYRDSSDTEISEIATKALAGSQKGIAAIENYRIGLNSDSIDQYVGFFDTGDTLMIEAVTLHDEAVDLYNEYSGATGAFIYRDILIAGTVIMLIVTAFLFFKSRRKDQTNLSQVRHEVFRSLMGGALTMAIGLGITAASYVWALESEGDTYLIMYGLVLVGAWRFLSELISYFRVGRKRIKEAEDLQRQTPLTPNEGLTPPPTLGT